jgi:hypothetical protein
LNRDLPFAFPNRIRLNVVRRGNVRRYSIRSDRLRLGHLRQTEIEQFYAALGDKNIRGLEITVDDAFAMRGVESV